MTPVREMQHCMHCERPLRGRIDKKFCDDQCRNYFNNQKGGRNEKPVRIINSILNKNRRILKTLYTARKFRVKKSTLLQLGYRFEFYTHRLSGLRGKTAVCCYDHGLTAAGGECYRVIRQQVS